jgi:hypothetical protein
MKNLFKKFLDKLKNRNLFFKTSTIFVNKLDIICSSIARSENLQSQAEITTRATEIFRDACRIEPETEKGRLARREAQEYTINTAKLVRISDSRPKTKEDIEILSNHPMFGVSEEKKKRLREEI